VAALLHDIGKLVTPAEILAKPGRLTDEELYVMREHALRGAELLTPHRSLRLAAPLVRGHHERVDGRGYPDGLEGDEIPPEVGIISVCDAWDAMTSERPYRAAMDPDRAAAILREHAGAQWDAWLVELLLDEVDGHGPPSGEPFPQLRPGFAAVCEDALPEGSRVIA
jgi:HD-GYP domain-containing protein (c-di-GMP phosphodiesterase class II)